MSPDMGIIVGEIRTDGDDPGKPFIRILDRREAAERTAQLGRCEHPNFVLDTQAHRVECGVCHEVIDPLAILARWAKYDAEIRRHSTLREMDARRLYRGLCAQLATKRHVHDTERAELLDWRTRWNASSEDLAKLYDRIDMARRERKRTSRSSPDDRSTR